MKKLLYTLILMLAAATMVACSSHDDEPSVNLSDLIGVWAVDPTFTKDENFVYVFADDGIYYYAVYFGKTRLSIDKAHWKISGREVTISQGGKSVVTILESLTTTNLVLSEKDSDWSISLTKTTLPN